MSRAAADASSDVLDRLLRSIRRQAGVDAAYLVEYRPEGALVRAIVGDGDMVGLAVGMPQAPEDAIALAAVAGNVPPVLEDTRTHRAARRLAWERAAPIGAFAGVPVRLVDGTLFGGLCVAHRRATSLGTGFHPFLAAMAEVVGDQLSDEQAVKQQSRREHEAVLGMFEEGRMTTVLQPIVDLADGRTLGVEALTRFTSTPPRPPNVWFAAAARQGLGLELEAAAISRAARLLPQLPADWHLAVNASPALIESDVLGDLLLDEVAHRLVVEVTEHAAVNDYGALNQRVHRLRERGIRVAVDDAGAGFASLRHVVELDPDVIKIDGSIVRGIDRAPLQAAMVETLCVFAARAGASVVAEAVETPDELVVLKDLGVPSAQGYLFASPGRPDDLRSQYPVVVPDAGRGRIG